MKISKYIHSCVLLEEGSDSLLFDPGMFSFMDESVTTELFKYVKAVIITHNHPDHIDVKNLKQILELSNAQVITTPEIAKVLAEEGITENVLTGREYVVGEFSIRAIPATHEAILSDTLPENYGYVINDRVLHPGDSFADSLTTTGADVVLLPITAPWATELGVFDFAKKCKPSMVIPIHDGYAKDFFQKSRYQNFEKNFEPLSISFKALQKAGDSTSI